MMLMIDSVYLLKPDILAIHEMECQHLEVIANSLQLKDALLNPRQFLITESPLKIVKNAF